VAQLLLKNPDLMILDDPFAGLPAAAALEMKDQIRAITISTPPVSSCVSFMQASILYEPS
jgi:ABC-type multidrug transport system ATPase subunit